MTDFFEEQKEEINESTETIKLGDKEYSQEDLSRLVGLGEIASEAEEKYKTKIDRVWPEYTKATQKMSDYERQIEELKAKIPVQTQENKNEVVELTEEQKTLARRQLEELGFGQEQVRAVVREEFAARELLSNVEGIISQAKDNGEPTTTAADLLQHMADEGIKNPLKAYKDMFESELDALKEKKLAEIKPGSMTTTTQTQAGSKTPAPAALPKNRTDLAKAVSEMLGGNQ